MEAREVAGRAGAVLLMALGIGSMALGFGGSIMAGGGILFLPLGLPPLVAGYAVWRRLPWSRVSGVAVALAYAGVVAYVATTPLRGLTPPPGQSGAALDPGSIVIALAFLLAAILILAGRSV
jgi:hypothetical protein